MLPLVLLLLPSALEIQGELTVPPRRLAVLSAKGVPPKAALVWDFDETKLHGDERHGKLFLVGPPGTYRIKLRAFTLDGDALRFETARASLTFQAPKPQPKPPPKPPAPPAPKANPLAALCRYRQGRTGCTATIIGPRRADGRWDVLCANHCGGRRGTITLKDGRTIAVETTRAERASDLMWLVTVGQYDDLPFALLATKAPPAGTAVWHAGYGVDRPR